ncbi:hypothetical protein SAMN04488003_10578 [Loktanella fryxellensis]|uniref:Uncharacterized protein n=1 Tax=Loktanella fryxellensis TaxID=245187 RepID=A0A1H8BKE6_9RHOB|nr:hypothetical protein [Loktanella fryxellensis]SEM83256.1 hypothetical protein SAMN04488003_10578 [Loktanella fryxellensis]
MITRILVVGLALTVAACAPVGDANGISRLGNNLPADPMPRATPQPALLTAKERLVGAIEANDCALTAGNVGNVLTQATISREELAGIVPELQAEGRVEASDNGTIRVISDRCI